MVSHPYLNEKLIAERHAQIRHEVQQSHMQAHIQQQRTTRQSLASWLGTLLRDSGAQRTGQRREASLRSS